MSPGFETHFLVCFASLIAVAFVTEAYVPCIPKSFGRSSIVCVCNETYCDTVPQTIAQEPGLYSVIVSSQSGKRLIVQNGTFKRPSEALKYTKPIVTLKFDSTIQYQTILGFGGAVTDAAGINIAKLSPNMQNSLLQSYFSANGIGYNIIRVNMAGCDFSSRVYSYDDHDGDFNLTRFQLAPEDTKLKIPIILRAQRMANISIRVFASPWSAPAWMKTNGKMYGNGSLKGSPGTSYYKTWAQYFIRFLQEYKKAGVDIWGLTVLNEPLNGFIYNFSFNCMGMTPQQERDFIIQDLGPALDHANFSHVKLMILDDQRFELPTWAKLVFSDPTAMKYVSGIGVHWYWDWIIPPNILDITHNEYPEKFILATEACTAQSSFAKSPVALGSWEQAERYAHDIIQDINHWVVGWTDWNIVLDMNGGPNWAKNYVDSPVIVDPQNRVFYKQPMFYVLAHFSAYVKPGCKRVNVHADIATSLEFIGFSCSGNSNVLVVLNKQDAAVNITIHDARVGDITQTLLQRSISTFTWRI